MDRPIPEYGKIAPVYITCFSNGSCGSFISAMIERYCSPWATNPILPGKYNSAHRMMMKPNYRSTRKHSFGRMSAKEFFDGMQKSIPWHPSFVETHYFAPVYMMSKFPEGKILAITHHLEDIKEIATNSFFKFIIGEGYDNLVKQTYSFLQSNAFFIADSFTIEDVQKDLAKFLRMGIHIRESNVIHSGFHLIRDDEKYKDLVTFINYSDIIRQPEKIMQTLSEFTQAPTTDFIKFEYGQYVERQFQFFEQVKEMTSEG